MTQLILIFCFSSLLLASAIILFSLYYQKRMREREIFIEITIKNHELELLKKIVETQENEREKIAKDIHDDLGPNMTIIKLHLTALSKSKLIKDNKLFFNITQEIDNVITELRSISQELSPTHVIRFGLNNSLIQLLDQISESTEITCTYNLCDLNEDELEKVFSINLYRLSNELLNNLLKHASPTRITIETKLKDAEYHLCITHNGLGLNNEEFSRLLETSSGQGIQSINSRINLLKGRIDLSKNPDLSTINLFIPINQ